VRIGEIVEPVERVSVIADDPEDDRCSRPPRPLGQRSSSAGTLTLSLGRWQEIAILSPAELLANLGPD
jgi:hypothetical protein